MADPDPGNPGVVGLVIQPPECLVILPQGGVKREPPASSPRRGFVLIQFGQQLACLIPPAGRHVGRPKSPSQTGGGLRRLLDGRDGLVIHPFVLVDESQNIVTDREPRSHFNRLPRFGGRLVVSPLIPL